MANGLLGMAYPLVCGLIDGLIILISFIIPNIHFSAMDSVADIIYEDFGRISFNLPSKLNKFLHQSTRHIIVGDNLTLDHLSWFGNSTRGQGSLESI